MVQLKIKFKINSMFSDSIKLHKSTNIRVEGVAFQLLFELGDEMSETKCKCKYNGQVFLGSGNKLISTHRNL